MRFVRNFYVVAQIDGRQGNIRFGPRAKNGGFRLTVYQRQDGASIRALDLQGYMGPDGTLRLVKVCRGVSRLTALRFPASYGNGGMVSCAFGRIPFARTAR